MDAVQRSSRNQHETKGLNAFDNHRFSYLGRFGVRSERIRGRAGGVQIR